MLAGAFAFTACKEDTKKDEQVKLEAQEEEMMEDDDKARTAMNDDEMSTEEAEKAKMEAETNSIAGKAMGNENLSTLVTAVKTADLAPMLSEPGSYTVFAPTNTAFEKLPEGTVANLLKPENKATLTGVLQYHVIKGNISADKLASAIKAGNGKYTFKTVSGNELTAMMDGDQIVLKDGAGNMAHVIQGNVAASNGVVHVIDNVLMANK